MSQNFPLIDTVMCEKISHTTRKRNNKNERKKHK